MRFLVDAQLPPALARALSDRGHDAEHVTDIGLGDAADHTIWRYALDNDAVLITKDEDFADLSARGAEAPTVIWVRLGNTSRSALLTWFTPLLDSIVEMVDAGNQLIELR